VKPYFDDGQVRIYHGNASDLAMAIKERFAQQMLPLEDTACLL
jgi:hypothetical protein